MQIPSLLYGEYGDVRKRCRQAIKRYARGEESFWAALAAGGMSDTAAQPALISVDGPQHAASGKVYYHCDVPLYLLTGDETLTLTDEMEEDIFAVGLDTPWSVLCMLMANSMYRWFPPNNPAYPRAERYGRYVRAIVRHWDVLDAEGRRYAGTFEDRGVRLWEEAGALKWVLAHLGVQREAIVRPLPPGGLYTVLAQADPSKAGDLIDLGKAHQDSWRSPWGDDDEQGRPFAIRPPFVFYASEAMSAAFRANDPAAVRRLVEAGEDVNGLDLELFRSPLLWAAEQGHTDLARFLLDRGANIEDKAVEGESSLLLAAFHGHRDTVRLLLDRGADPAYRTDKGGDVVMFAELGKHDDLAALLQQAQDQHEAPVDADYP